MALFKRTPREFHIHIGTPWTINGKPTSSADPKAALAEIYDTAELFPITITVTGPDIEYVLEMDEYMSTHVLDDTAEEEAVVDPQPLAADDEPKHETQATRPQRQRPDFTALRAKLTPRRVGIGAAAMLVICLIVSLFVFNKPESNAEAQAEAWKTELSAPSLSDAPINQAFAKQLWVLNPGDVKSAAGYAAGVLTTTGKRIQLRDHTTGDELAAYKADPEKLESVTEFRAGKTPTIGLRFSDKFVALTAEGKTQEWKVAKDSSITVYGDTPLVSAGSVHQALIVGTKAPVDLTPNPDLPVRAIDGEWIVQPQIGSARVAMNPVHRDSSDATAHYVDLIPPKAGAVFTRHLDVGRGKALVLWTIDEKLFVSIHALQGEPAGQAVSTVPAPFTEDKATSWTLGTGMDLALLGPYAFSMTTGETEAYNPKDAFTKAYGNAAVIVDANGKQTIALDHTLYPVKDQIIGTTDTTILVRLADGSVAAYGKSGGKE